VTAQSTTTADIAVWMLEQVKREGILYQADAAYEIEENFGTEFVYDNDSGGVSIQRDVLDVFRSISEEIVVWERPEKAWRLREAGDGPGRLAE